MTTSYDSVNYARVNRWDSSHLDRIDRLVRLRPGERVLEVGCGQGHLTKALADRGVDITGIDVNPNAREIAGSERVMHMSASDLDFESESFDAVISVHAIEHIPPLEEALSEMVRVLKPAGRAGFVYPAEPIKGLYAIPTAVILHGNPLKAREVHCHKIWPAKLREMLVPLGMRQTRAEFSLLKSPQFSSAFVKAG